MVLGQFRYPYAKKRILIPISQHIQKLTQTYHRPNVKPKTLQLILNFHWVICMEIC